MTLATVALVGVVATVAKDALAVKGAKAQVLESKPIKPSSKEPIYLGLEIEAVMKAPHQHKPGLAKFVSDLAASPVGDHMIAKSDGSIGANGLELVTIPATLAYHKKFLDEHFFGALKNYENI